MDYASNADFWMWCPLCTKVLCSKWKAFRHYTCIGHTNMIHYYLEKPFESLSFVLNEFLIWYLQYIKPYLNENIPQTEEEFEDYDTGDYDMGDYEINDHSMEDNSRIIEHQNYTFIEYTEEEEDEDSIYDSINPTDAFRNIIRDAISYIQDDIFDGDDDDSDNETQREINNAVNDAHTSRTNEFDTNIYYPFSNRINMLCILFFKGGRDKYSRREISSIMYLLQEVVKASHILRDKTCQGQTFNPLNGFPSVNFIRKYKFNKNNKIPVFKSEETTVETEKGAVKTTLNCPETILKLLIANPLKTRQISLLADRSPNQRGELNKGDKWNFDPEFRCPMLSRHDPQNIINHDFWIGDIVSCSSTENRRFIVSNFITINSQTYFECFELFPEGTSVGINLQPLNQESIVFPVSSIIIESIEKCTEDFEDTIYSAYCNNEGVCFASSQILRIMSVHHSLFAKIRQLNQRLRETGATEARLIGYNISSDDTSGNTSKKWNKYESYFMTPAAMPLDLRNKYENQYFISTNHDINGMEAAQPLVKNMTKLERGVVMFDISTNKMTLVFAPLLFINGDNVLHDDIACNKRAMCNFPCRRCFWMPIPTGLASCQLTTSTENYVAPYRSKEMIVDFTKNNNKNMQVGIHVKNRGRGLPYVEKSYDKLGFKKTGGEIFSTLKAFDPIWDTPVESLHTILLGTMKSLFDFVALYYFNQAQIECLEQLFHSYDSKAYHRSLASDLTYYASFLGRDYKIMIQTITIIFCIACDTSISFSGFLNEDNNPNKFNLLFPCFDKLGELGSLMYTPEINGLEQFNNLLKDTVSKLISSIDSLYQDVLSQKLQNATEEQRKKINMSKYRICNKLKSHLLYHLTEDISRFSSGPHTESEKGEESNKYVRINIFHTNRKNTSRDVAFIFGEELMLRHIAQGGVWDDGQNKSGSGVIEFTQSEDYKKYFGDSDVELVDNNNAFKNMVLGLTCLLKIEQNNGLKFLLGKTVSKIRGEKSFSVDVYEFIHNESITLSESIPIYESCIRDSNGNFLAKRLPNHSFILTENMHFECVEVFDMLQPVEINGDLVATITKNKFGTLWFTKSHNSLYQSIF